MRGDGLGRVAWARRPLCRSYVFGVFDVATARWCDARGKSAHRMHWALGWLPDGECEPLGVWIERPSDGVGPILADLKERGVGRIWRVVGAEGWSTATRRDATILVRSVSRSALALDAGAGAVLPQHGVASPLLFADQVREALGRAIRRHGSFEDESAALGLVAGVLQRAERRLDRERLVANEQSRLAAGAKPTKLGA